MLILTFLFYYYREDRETEHLIKLDNLEMRDPPNTRMISHFQKMIGITRNRIVVAKNRSHQLRKKYEEGMNLKESKKCRKKNKKDDYTDELLKV